MKLGYFCALYIHFEMYTKWAQLFKKNVLNLRRQILGQKSEIVLKGDIDSNFKATYCVCPEIHN